MGIQPLSIFYPMLSKRSNESMKYKDKPMVEAAALQMDNHNFIMETKIDGERMIFHLLGPKVLLHSRKGMDYTAKYQVLVNGIKAIVQHSRIDGCIIDGEVVAWDKANNRALPFGHNRTIGNASSESRATKFAKEESDEDLEPEEETHLNGVSSLDSKSLALTSFENLPNQLGEAEHLSATELRIIVFDCLYLSGDGASDIIKKSVRDARTERLLRTDNQLLQDLANGNGQVQSLLGLPLAVRRLVLERIVGSSGQLGLSNIMSTVNSRIVTSMEPEERRREMQTFFAARNAAGEEGIVVKSLEAPYILNNRSTTTWLKLKADYSSTFADMDLLVMGGYYGMGKCTGMFSSFAVALRADEEDALGQLRYYPCGKVGSGYTFSELTELNKHFKSLQGAQELVPWPSDAKQPESSRSWLADWDAKGDVRPDFLMPPGVQSVVFTVKCTELIASRDFPTSQALRFPRVQRVRMDKRAEDVLSFGEWQRKASSPRPELVHTALADSKRRKNNLLNTKSIVDPRYLSSANYELELSGSGLVGGTFFQGRAFVVHRNSFVSSAATDQPNSNLSFEFICTLIQKNGGCLMQCYSLHEDPLVIVGKARPFDLSLRNLIKHENCTVAVAEYVLACAHAQQCLPLAPTHYLVCSSGAQSEMYGVDLFGDDGKADASEDNLSSMIGTASLAAERYFNQVKAESISTGKKRAAADLALGSDAAQKKGKRDIAKDWASLAKLTADAKGLWRKLAEELDDEVQMVLRKGSGLSFWDPHCTYYADGDDVELQNVVARLSARGAYFNAALTAEVTHVITHAKPSSERAHTLEATLLALGLRVIEEPSVAAPSAGEVNVIQMKDAKRWLT